MFHTCEILFVVVVVVFLVFGAVHKFDFRPVRNETQQMVTCVKQAVQY